MPLPVTQLEIRMETELPRTAEAVAAAPCFEPVAPAMPSIPWIARFLPSLTDIAFLMPIFFLFIKLNGARKLLGDGDTGWHIRTGEWMLANGHVPHTDMFSFTRPGQPWFAWEWLWDLVFAGLNARWGMGAVVLASVAMICVTSALLFRLVRRKCGNGLVAIAVTLLATGGCAIHWLARPHLFTLLFFTVALHLTERAAAGRTKLLVWLVPLTLLWVNLHGGFFVVFLVLATYIGDRIAQVAVEASPAERRLYLNSLRPWLLTFAGCFAVTFINPYGWNLHKHMVEYLADPYNLRYINEFQSMDFHAPVTIYCGPLMLIGSLAALWHLKHRRFQEVFLTFGWMLLALTAQRNIPLFSIAVAPIVAEALMAVLQAAPSSRLAGWLRTPPASFLSMSAGVDETDRIPRLYLVSALPLALIGMLLLLPKPVSAKFAVTYDPADYPEQALSILGSDETHRIFTDDEWGDYLIYKLYPAHKVFVDGRSDFYGDEFGLEYQKLLSVSYDFEKVLDKYGIDTIALSPRFSLTTALKYSSGWKVVYDDHVAVIFRRSQAAPVSVASSGDRKDRDRGITNTNRDLLITTTKPNPRGEQHQ